MIVEKWKPVFGNDYAPGKKRVLVIQIEKKRA
jgi:hypothetical protein